MEKIFIVEEIFESDDGLNVKSRVCSSYQKAKNLVEEIKDNYKHLIEDIKKDIEDDCYDSEITDIQDYFYAYDGCNFKTLIITIEESEVL